MDLDPKMSVSAFVRMILKRADGVLLVVLVIAFLVFAVTPTLPETLGLTHGNEGEKLRLAFLVMPAVLIAVYVWFLSSFGNKQHSLVVSAVLLATAAIPFFKTLKDFL